MQRASVVLAVPVACVFACGDATQPATTRHLPVVTPAFSVTVPHGAAAWTSCTASQGNYVYDPHFDPNYFPTTTFVDTGYPALADQCGDLVFDNRVRSFTTVYATDYMRPAENPWKYWWRRGRYADDGSGALAEVRTVSVPAGTPDTAVIQMPLSNQYDAVAVVLVTDSSAAREISDLPFTSTTAGEWGDLNLKVQHWREITPPTPTSVTHEDGFITLVWQNAHAERSIDSTNIYRNGQPRATVGPGDTSYTEQSPGAGTWTYTLKHLSWPAARAGDVSLQFPNSDTSAAISITLGTACARQVESPSYTNTWQVADQYLSAGCSELGATKRFRWYGAGDVALTNWSSDTLFDFLGHVSTGTQLVVLKDSNTTSHATSRDTLAVTVWSGQVVLAGPTFITDKSKKLYVATAGGERHWGTWYERYDDGPRWFAASAYEQDTLARIWPYGDYTVTLRQHKYTGVLRRGRRLITVCSVPECEPNVLAALETGAPAPGDAWGLFGAGPWLGWGSPDAGRTLRLYDLWGMHDPVTPFTHAGWMMGEGGVVRDPATGWQVSWTPRDLGLADVRAVDFMVSGAGPRTYIFSMAVDPDVGAHGGDDVASYDSQRALVLVADQATAVGFLLLDPRSRNALVTVQEYGVGRWAPAVGPAAWAAQRLPGVQLRGTPGDVQLLLSGGETTGDALWTFVVMRGDSREAVRGLADEVLRALR